MTAPHYPLVGDGTLREMWVAAGGQFFGPHVETGSMPEHLLLPFLRKLMTDQAAMHRLARLNALEEAAHVCDVAERLAESFAKTLPHAHDRLRADDRRFLSRELAGCIRALKD